MPRPADERPDATPWPTFPLVYRVSSAHEENGDRVYSVSTQRFVDDGQGQVRALELVDVRMVDGRFEAVPGSEREIPADLVTLAMGFTGPEAQTVVDQLGLGTDGRGNLERDASWSSSQAGVFVAGDAGRGQSLIVWAIAEGRAAAAAVDEYLTGGTTNLPAPVRPTDRPLTV
jgi:glutamate synthase (NADPH) small chain